MQQTSPSAVWLSVAESTCKSPADRLNQGHRSHKTGCFLPVASKKKKKKAEMLEQLKGAEHPDGETSGMILKLCTHLHLLGIKGVSPLMSGIKRQREYRL